MRPTANGAALSEPRPSSVVEQSLKASPVGHVNDARFEAALLRAQYRSLARLGPYVHLVVTLATVAVCVAARQRSTFLDGFILPAALVAVSLGSRSKGATLSGGKSKEAIRVTPAPGGLPTEAENLASQGRPTG